MQYVRLRVALAAACWLGAAASAQTIYTDRAAFNAATSNQVVTDFNNLGASGSFYATSYSGTNFTLTNNTNVIVSYDPTNSPSYNFNSGDVLAFDRNSSATTGTFTPAAGVTAFGFDFGFLNGFTDTKITINNIDYTPIGQPTFNFFGIVGPSDVAPISINFGVGRGVIDNVVVASAAVTPVTPVANGVPEPASWAMMIVGFGAIGGALRRQRTGVRFA